MCKTRRNLQPQPNLAFNLRFSILMIVHIIIGRKIKKQQMRTARETSQLYDVHVNRPDSPTMNWKPLRALAIENIRQVCRMWMKGSSERIEMKGEFSPRGPKISRLDLALSNLSALQ